MYIVYLPRFRHVLKIPHVYAQNASMLRPSRHVGVRIGCLQLGRR